MLDVRRIRADPGGVTTALARRGDAGATAALIEVAELDADQRRLAVQRDELRAGVKDLTRQVGALRRDGDVAGAEALQNESRVLGEQATKAAAAHDVTAARVRDLLLRIPNTPSPDAPDGAGPDDNVVLRTEGPPVASFAEHQWVPHWEIGAELDLLDPERATKLSGAMFTIYRGWGARLLRAMVTLSLDRNADAYVEVRPPTLVRTDTMVATGHLPKFDDDAYHVERDDLWAIPTAEVPLTSLHRDEVLAEAALPLRYTAYSSCYRREAGAAGRDTRGLLRSHEFDKVELLAVAADAAQAQACQEDILGRVEALLGDLGLAYRVLDLCAGDLSGSAARTWDVEAYAPGTGQWLEVSSVSWFGEYPARRAAIRWRPDDASGTRMCHTVNGSALGWPRTVAAYLESHRLADGTVGVVDALRPLLGVDTIPLPPGRIRHPEG